MRNLILFVLVLVCLNLSGCTQNTTTAPVPPTEPFVRITTPHGGQYVHVPAQLIFNPIGGWGWRVRDPYMAQMDSHLPGGIHSFQVWYKYLGQHEFGHEDTTYYSDGASPTFPAFGYQGFQYLSIHPTETDTFRFDFYVHVVAGDLTEWESSPVAFWFVPDSTL